LSENERIAKSLRERVRENGIYCPNLISSPGAGKTLLLERTLATFPNYLFIENVGNLVCPSSYDLGEHDKIVILSVTEGEDKPLKYPATFSRAGLVIINKIDLLPYVQFDIAKPKENILKVHPGAVFLEGGC